MEKPRQPKVGDAIVFFDSLRRECNALITDVHGEVSGGPVEGHPDQGWYTPCINLLYLTPESEKLDSYGRQSDHASSCSYVDQQRPPVGYYWCWPEEVETSRPDESQVGAGR